VVKRFFVAVVCAVALFSSTSAQAAPILIPDSDGVIGTVLFDLIGNPLAYSVSGASVANVVDAVPLTSGVIAAADTDTALFVDFGIDDAYLFDFNFATSVFDASGLWTLVVAGTPIIATDPSLLPFFGDNVGQFAFLSATPFLNPETQEVIGIVANYSLEFIAAQEDVTAVPEPATMTLVGLGLAAAARRRAKKNQAA
jgi:PEP-CTERM motif